jgi:hypothetical protein
LYYAYVLYYDGYVRITVIYRDILKVTPCNVKLWWLTVILTYSSWYQIWVIYINICLLNYHLFDIGKSDVRLRCEHLRKHEKKKWKKSISFRMIHESPRDPTNIIFSKYIYQIVCMIVLLQPTHYQYLKMTCIWISDITKL